MQLNADLEREKREERTDKVQATFSGLGTLSGGASRMLSAEKSMMGTKEAKKSSLRGTKTGGFGQRKTADGRASSAVTSAAAKEEEEAKAVAMDIL